MSRDSRRNLVERWRVIQSSFLTEDGQSFYLQAREKESHGDCPGAIALIGRSLVLEKGNVELLKFRARCEFKGDNYVAHYETLKQAHGEFPFDSGLQEDLAEAHLRYQQPQRVVELWENETDALTPRKRLALAFAYLDTGADARAASLAAHPTESRTEPEFPWSFVLGALSARRGNAAEAIHHWEGFLKTLEKRVPAASDPYRLKERAEEARAWMARKVPPKNGLPVTKNVS